METPFRPGAKRPDHIVTPGAEIVDGVGFDFIPLEHAETEHALMVGFRTMAF